MSVHIFFDDEITVRRLKTSGSTRVFQATATVWADIQEVDLEEAEKLNLHPSRAFKVYTDLASDVKRGDKLQIVERLQEGSRETTRTKQFTVKNVDQPKGWLVDHKVLIVEELIE